MIVIEKVRFPKRYKPLPPGYRIVFHDSGHFQRVWASQEETSSGDWSKEGFISVDKFWVRRCVFAHAEKEK